MTDQDARAQDAEIHDDRDHHRFVYRQDASEGELVYRTEGDRLVLVHTEVAEALEGHGIGGRLVQAAVDRAAKTGETVVPQCPYARSWLEKHPDQAHRVTIDWPPS
jgi:predicted GNAT family acetyltransferase